MSIDWTRTRSLTTPKGTDTYWWTNTTGTAEHGLSSATPHASEWQGSLGQIIQTTQDMEVPGWKSRIERGEIINNPFITTKTDYTYSNPQGMSCRYSDSRSTQRIWCATHNTYHDRVTDLVGNWQQAAGSYLETLSGGVDPAVMRQSVIDQAVTSAHANIDVSEMLALATAAESRKTVESMTAIALRAYKVFRHVRKLNFAGLRKELTPKELANRYMEARYAIRPMIYDAYGVAGVLEKERGYERRTFRGYADDSNHNEQTVVGTGAPVSDDWKKTIDLVYSARAGVLCDVSISDITVLGIDKLAETAWELVPWSFVADWFANTGDWIAAHSPDAGVTQRASWVTVKKVLTKTQTVTGSRWNLVAGQSPISLNRPKATYTVEESVLERIVSPALSTWPSFNMRLDGYKLTDLGIMIRGIFR